MAAKRGCETCQGDHITEAYETRSRAYISCERDIRMTKLRQKVSGCLRTLTGARQFCAIRSYLSTAAKHDRTFFDALVMLTGNRPWIPAA
jgi:hypothetical protein